MTLALATLGGTMIIGGLLGTLAQFLGVDWVTAWLPSVGWCLGGALGVGSEIGRLSKGKKAKSNSNLSAKKQNESSEVEHYNGLRYRTPTVPQVFKGIGLGGLFGCIAGLATATILIVLLLSVTTSPFVPRSWRPSTRAPTPKELRDERARGAGRDGVRTDFQHPWMRPIVVYSLTSITLVGLVAGAGLSFFEDDGRTDSPENEEAPNSKVG